MNAHGQPMDRPRVVVVTGASAGVGRATVRELARRGDSIGLLARGTAGLDATRREVEELGARALAIPTDVAYADAVESAAEWIETELGPIDAWINAAMVSVLAPVKDTTADEIRRVTEVTYLGAVNGTLSALRRMLPRDSGVIVQVGSALAYRSIPLQAAYCGAKHALVGFTDSLRSELIHDDSRVRVTAVHLPALNTPQFEWVRNKLPHRTKPVPPIYQPEVAARAIVRAVDRPQREILVGGSTVLAVHGTKVAPGLLDRYLATSAYSGQQTDELEDPARQDNLVAPVERDMGAHGRFDDEAMETDAEAGVVKRGGRVALAGAAGLIAAALALRTRRSS
jgi:short-subunit dehydrogenase